MALLAIVPLVSSCAVVNNAAQEGVLGPDFAAAANDLGTIREPPPNVLCIRLGTEILTAIRIGVRLLALPTGYALECIGVSPYWLLRMAMEVGNRHRDALREGAVEKDTGDRKIRQCSIRLA